MGVNYLNEEEIRLLVQMWIIIFEDDALANLLKWRISFYFLPCNCIWLEAQNFEESVYVY